MFAKGTATIIGSWPFTDPGRAVRFVMDRFPDLPAWPQLPRMGFLENMYVQFTQGFPRVVIDPAAERIHFDTTGDIFADIQPVYEAFLAGGWDTFGISPEYARGLYGLRDEVKKIGRLPAVKGQLIGPLSFGLTVTDQDKKLLLYDEQLADAVLKACVAKAVWQARFLKELADTVVVFIDEPYLVSYGSAYISLGREQVVSMLNEVIGALHEAGAIAGVHCCGSTDWSILTDTEVDVINFDAYNYGASLMLYPRQIQDFLARGADKCLAWGIVPTAEGKAAVESAEGLCRKLRSLQARLAELGVDRSLVEERAILTPACGMGSVSEETAIRAADLLGGLSRLYISG